MGFRKLLNLLLLLEISPKILCTAFIHIKKIICDIYKIAGSCYKSKQVSIPYFDRNRINYQSINVI